MIIPAGLLGEARANALRVFLVEHRRILHIIQLYSSEEIFPAIVAGQPLTIIEYINAPPAPSLEFRGNLRKLSQLALEEGSIPISIEFLARISPNFSDSRHISTSNYTIPFLESPTDFNMLNRILQFPKLASG